MTTFEALAHKTRAAATIEELNKIEARHEKHYNNGTITQAELIRLDRMAMNQYVKIIEETIRKNHRRNNKTMTTQDIHRAIASIEWAIRLTYADRHRVNRRYCRTALTEIRDYIRTLRTLRTALSLYQ